MVTAADIIMMGASQYQHPRSGSYDMLNGDHPWAYWCLSYVESTHRNVGLNVPAYPSAVASGRAHGLLPGRAPLGAVIYFDEDFYYPDGHVALSLGDGRCLGTVTDGTGVGLMWWNETTVGYMGWCYFDGVDDQVRPDPPPPSSYRQPGNPYETAGEIIIGGGFLRYYQGVGAGIDPMVVTGFACENERDATVTDADGTSRVRTIQVFERQTLLYQPENPFPHDIVAALASQTIQ